MYLHLNLTQESSRRSFLLPTFRVPKSVFFGGVMPRNRFTFGHIGIYGLFSALNLRNHILDETCVGPL